MSTADHPGSHLMCKAVWSHSWSLWAHKKTKVISARKRQQWFFKWRFLKLCANNRVGLQQLQVKQGHFQKCKQGDQTWSYMPCNTLLRIERTCTTGLWAHWPNFVSKHNENKLFSLQQIPTFGPWNMPVCILQNWFCVYTKGRASRERERENQREIKKQEREEEEEAPCSRLTSYLQSSSQRSPPRRTSW